MASFFSTLFGGGAEREAANANRAAYGQYGADANRYLDTGLNRSVGAVTDASNAAGDYFGRNYGLYGDLRNAGTGILDAGKAQGLAALGQAGDAYLPMEALAKKYGNATSLYQDSLGVNGAAGNANAVNAFQAGPGYQFTLDQGLNALNRRRAAAGMLNSGNADVDALTYGTGLANQTYGDWQSKLAGFINPELSATSGAATGRAGVSQAIANLVGQDTLSRLGLEQGVTQGRAGVNTAQAANATALGNSLSNLYGKDAQNRVNVAGTVTGGNVSANNLQAQGETQGSRNLLNAGMGLASLAAGSLGGGGMFGANGAFGSRAVGLMNPSRTNTFGFNPLAGAFSYGGNDPYAGGGRI